MRFTIAAILAATSLSAANLPEPFTVHEWGTFTSVAGPEGNPVVWAPLSGTPDLPCFVEHLGTGNLKQIQSLVRMETPVLYFYSQRPVTASVRVDFPQGWITEWYPQASKITPDSPTGIPLGIYQGGRLEWNSVQVLPGSNLVFPSGSGASRYYAARNTDSAPLMIGSQAEKLIFYRGIGSFAAPLRPMFLSDGRLEIRNAGAEAVALAVVFENRAGKVGYRIVRGIKDAATVEPPELTADIGDLRRELTQDLVSFGLYQKEAAAMVETWRDSWFEEGMRVFYILPRPEVDALLPLTIHPAPDATARVFVGRVEVLSPWMRRTIEAALAHRDTATLAKFGRFLEPFMQQVRGAAGTWLPPLQRTAQICIP